MVLWYHHHNFSKPPLKPSWNSTHSAVLSLGIKYIGICEDTWIPVCHGERVLIQSVLFHCVFSSSEPDNLRATPKFERQQSVRRFVFKTAGRICCFQDKVRHRPSLPWKRSCNLSQEDQYAPPPVGCSGQGVSARRQTTTPVPIHMFYICIDPAESSTLE